MRFKNERVRLRDLPQAQRDELESQLIKLVLESHSIDASKDTIRNVLFRGCSPELLLFRDENHQIVGFGSFDLAMHEYQNKPVAVLDGGIHLGLRARGAGLRTVLPGVLEILRFKLRHPFTKLCYIGAASNPAIYRLVARTCYGVFPRLDAEPPSELSALVRRVHTHRGAELVQENPWRVRMLQSVAPVQRDRIRAFSTRGDPHAAFFVKACPRFDQGEWMAIFVPFDLRQLATASYRSLRLLMRKRRKSLQRAA